MSEYYYQIKGQAKTLNYKLQQLYPPAQFQLIKESDGSAEDIQSGNGFAILRKYDDTQIFSGNSINITDGANGKGEYRWQANDITVVGNYYLQFVIDPNGDRKYIYIPEGDMRFNIVVT